MRTLIALCASALASAFAPEPAAAQAPADPVAVVSITSSPVLAVDPVTHAPHVAFLTSGALVHSWKSAGRWLADTVATGAASFSMFGLADLRVNAAGRPAALFIDAGGVEYAERVGGAWQIEPLASGTALAVALAMSPLSGEPVAVWASRPLGPGTPAEIHLARRSAGTWTMQLLDTTSARSPLSVAVAVDAADRPVAAWSRPRADAVFGLVLTCAMAAGPEGPFTAEPVDSLLQATISLALDPASGRPRIAYAAAGSSGRGGAVQYAARTAGGSWDVMTATTWQVQASAPSLALDPGGEPYIVHTGYSPVGPEDGRAAAPRAAQCFYSQTGSVEVIHRTAAEGAGAFAFVAYMIDFDPGNGPRALDASGPDGPAVAWNSPFQYVAGTCPPYTVAYALAAPAAGVGPGPGARVGLGALSPDPVRLGDAVRAGFTLAEAADVTLELHDVAGRLVDSRALATLEAGPHAVDWAPTASRAGIYWLSLRAGGRSLGARSLVIVR